MTATTSVSDVHQLLALLELTDAFFYEVSARRLTDGEQSTDEEPGVALEVKVGSDERGVEVRLVGTYSGLLAHLRVDAACLFQSQEPFDAPEPVVREFAEKIGVMTVYPYLREALTEAAVKIRAPAPVMALIRPGQITLSAHR